jgi:hypothetical protein
MSSDAYLGSNEQQQDNKTKLLKLPKISSPINFDSNYDDLNKFNQEIQLYLFTYFNFLI